MGYGLLYGALLGLSNAAKLKFGGNECEYGPSFWCQDIKKANQCDAIPYCAEGEVCHLFE